MSRSIHISDAQRMLNRREPVNLLVWKRDGSIMALNNAVSLRYSVYGGYRNVKLLASGERRKIRDVCIFSINDMEVYL